MKKKTKIIFALAAACAGTLVLGACAEANPYEGLGDVLVHFDSNGGRFLSRDGVNVTQAYKLEDIQKGIIMYAPDDADHIRSDYLAVAERSGYFLAGWYQNREPRVNDAGEPLDEEGNVCNIRVDLFEEDGVTPLKDEHGDPAYKMVSEKGKEPGYTYSDPWTFGTKLTLDDFKEGEHTDYELTLYAAWIPQFTYRINMEYEGEWQTVATRQFDHTKNAEMKEISIPKWDWNYDEEKGEWSGSGAMVYGSFPTANLTKKDETVVPLTFSAVYGTKEKTTTLQSITHPCKWDEATATAVESDIYIDYYADYDIGNWFQIHTVDQLIANAASNGSYRIYADLEFTEEKTWPNAFQGSFSGAFLGVDEDGNPATRKISNASVTNDSTDSYYGGLFGQILAGSTIKNINFENVTFTLARGARSSIAEFGLFAGDVSTSAVIQDVTLSGTFRIGYIPQVFEGGEEEPFLFSDYTKEVGIVAGSGLTSDQKIDTGVNYSNITVVSVYPEGLEVTPVTEGEDAGTIQITKK